MGELQRLRKELVIIGGVLAAAAIVGALLVWTVSTPGDDGPRRIYPTTTDVAAPLPRIPVTPMTTPPQFVPPTSQAARCDTAPSKLVDMINASFIGGEYLEHAQAVDGPQDATYVGGNIFGSDGRKASSQDTWVLVRGVLYSLTSDARRRTLLPDGRDVPAIDWDWPDYNAAVSECVGAVERAENTGR